MGMILVFGLDTTIPVSIDRLPIKGYSMQSPSPLARLAPPGPVSIPPHRPAPVLLATAASAAAAYNLPTLLSTVMTSDQAAQLIDNTLDLVHQRLLDLEAQRLDREHRALAAEFREWRQPVGGHIDLMVFPGLANP
jgi:hypothetical protein